MGGTSANFCPTVEEIVESMLTMVVTAACVGSCHQIRLGIRKNFERFLETFANCNVIVKDCKHHCARLHI